MIEIWYRGDICSVQSIKYIADRYFAAFVSFGVPCFREAALDQKHCQNITKKKIDDASLTFIHNEKN